MNYSDILLYTPHSCVDQESVREVFLSQKTHKVISEELLMRYMIHSADIGTFEIATKLQLLLRASKPNLRVTLMSGPTPRAWCDMNRPWELAVPNILDASMYQESYDSHLAEVRLGHNQTQIAIHIHSMCARSPVRKWALTKETEEADLLEHLEKDYTGTHRNINLLERLSTGELVADMGLSNAIGYSLTNAGYQVDRDIAYQLCLGYPATELMQLCPSVLIEYTKNLLATDETSECIDTSTMVLDSGKIDRFAELLCQAVKESPACQVGTKKLG